MTKLPVAKPVISISLLPAEWGEIEFKRCFYAVLAEVKNIEALRIKTEKDLIILFPADRMGKGLGEEIVVLAEVPSILMAFEDVPQKVVETVYRVLHGILPDAYIQCRAITFDAVGFTSSGTEE